MTLRKIVYSDNPILREKAKKVRDFDANLHRLLDDMLETMLDAPGVGLAAPQINVGLRVIVVHLPDDDEDDDADELYGEDRGVTYEVVNPEIIKASRDVVEGVEACLSIPNYFGTVDRAVSIVVRGQDRYGKEIRIKAYDWLARVFQHEIDHLDGILYTDLAKEVWKAGETPPSMQEEAGDGGEPAAEENPAG